MVLACGESPGAVIRQLEAVSGINLGRALLYRESGLEPMCRVVAQRIRSRGQMTELAQAQMLMKLRQLKPHLHALIRKLNLRDLTLDVDDIDGRELAGKLSPRAAEMLRSVAERNLVPALRMPREAAEWAVGSLQPSLPDQGGRQTADGRTIFNLDGLLGVPPRRNARAA